MSENEQMNETQMYSSDVKTLKKGDTVKGKIVKIDEDEVFVDIGYKFDGVIPRQELSAVTTEGALQSIQLGEEVELKILQMNEQQEKIVLSKRIVDMEQAWQKLQQNLTEQTTIVAVVTEVVKGGLVVDVGVRGFVPASMVERTYIQDFSGYVGRTLRLRVKEIDREKNKVILSQKEILEEQFALQKQAMLEKIKAGQVLDGTVTRISSFGVFVDIGGIEGLVHLSEMTWKHIKDPAEIVKIGDSLHVQVLKVEKEKISLSMKSLIEGPWSTADQHVKAGEVVHGNITRLTQFGAFVEIAEGIEGLVHISQLSDRRIGHPSEVVKPGQSVKVKILEMNLAEKRISLSIKEAEYEADRDPSSAKSRLQNQQTNEEKEILNAPNEALLTTLAERLGDKLKNFTK